ncbi:hypothetical protein GCM10027080_25130 [Pedococcus soli]
MGSAQAAEPSAAFDEDEEAPALAALPEDDPDEEDPDEDPESEPDELDEPESLEPFELESLLPAGIDADEPLRESVR